VGHVGAVTTAHEGITYRTDWIEAQWGNSILDFWDDFSTDGRLDERPESGASMPMASLAVEVEIPAGGRVDVPFLLAWHFPNRYSWTRPETEWTEDDLIGNYYTTQYADAWDVAERTAQAMPVLEERTRRFVRAFLESDLPDEVKEAALFNVSTLRTQTCFRTPDGRFYGWERVRPTPRGAATVRARTCGTTSRPRHFSMAASHSRCARWSSRTRPITLG